MHGHYKQKVKLNNDGLNLHMEKNKNDEELKFETNFFYYEKCGKL
jgi:hypothetical protein